MAEQPEQWPYLTEEDVEVKTSAAVDMHKLKRVYRSTESAL